MTLKQRIRALIDAQPGRYMRPREVQAVLSDTSLVSIAVLMGKMAKDGQLVRRGKRLRYEYRSGHAPVTAPGRGPKRRGPRSGLGFMALARLERTDPAAYAKAVAADGKRP